MNRNDNYTQIINAFETHDVEVIRASFLSGINPNDFVKEKPLIYELINMYYRSPSFSSCIQTFVAYGLIFDDPVLLAVLQNDSECLDRLLLENPSLLEKRYTLDCTFTPLVDVPLLHICAEYNLVDCAKTLVNHGADINAKAGLDANGLGGHTAIFHTVNQHENRCIDMLYFLINHSADTDQNVKGLIWGHGYPWETYIPSINLIGYAMMGLLRQFQRNENDIYTIVDILMQKQYGINYFPSNIPNKYLYGDP